MELKKISVEGLEGKALETVQTINAQIDALSAIEEKSAKATELKSISEKLEALEGKEFETSILKLKNAILKMEAKMQTPIHFGAQKGIKDLLIESKALDGLKNKQQTEFEIKAVGDETTSNVAVADTAPKMSILGVNGTPYAVNRNFITNIMNVVDLGSSDKATIVYVDEVEGEGTVGTTAEGVAKNQIDIDFKEVTVNSEKYTGLVKVTEEALDDISFMSGEINRVLNEKLAMAKSSAILTDILAKATTYSLTDYNGKVNDADNVDVVVAAATQSLLSGFAPTAIIMHPVDIAACQLAKSVNMPRVATDANGLTINGLRVIPSAQITKDNFVLGDFSKYRVRIYKEKLVMGWDADDFSKNKRTIIAETRLLKYISTNEKTTLVKGVFSTIKTALETA